jgi:GTP-binding protein
MYNQKLMECPQFIVANKIDVETAEEQFEVFRQKCEENGITHPIYKISTLTKEGIQELLYKTMDVLEQTPAFPLVDEVEAEERIIYRLQRQANDRSTLFEIQRDNEVYVVVSESIEKLMKRTNFRTEQSIMRFAHTLRKMGIDQALRQNGAKDGDIVRIGTFEFEFVEFD